jgi:hypothetical protein
VSRLGGRVGGLRRERLKSGSKHTATSYQAVSPAQSKHFRPFSVKGQMLPVERKNMGCKKEKFGLTGHLDDGVNVSTD